MATAAPPRPAVRRPRAALRLASAALASLAAGLLAGCVHGPPETGAWGCRPHFPYRDGWLGADAAYSVALSETETLWLFGDTFVGAPAQRDRAGAHFVHNTVALSTCDAGLWDIRYYWGSDDAGRVAAFLERDDGDAWWWLFDGFVHDGALYVGLLEVERGDPRGPLALPFRFTGLRLGRVENPDDAPPLWRWRALPLVEGDVAQPASALVVHGSHVYLFAFLDRGDGRSPRGLARIPLAALAGGAPAAALESLACDGSWRPGLDPDDLRLLMTDNATEMSVTWREDLGRWLAVYSHPNRAGTFATDGPSHGVYVRTAEALAGPWSGPALVFEVPELDADYAGGYQPGTACYAAKEHPQLSTPPDLTFTYVCNLISPGADEDELLERLAGAMNLYRPIAVSISLPLDLAAAAPDATPACSGDP